MGRKVPIDPYIRSKWESVSVKFPRQQFTDEFLKDLEEWCETSFPGRYSYEFCFLGFDYRGMTFYFKDAVDATHFKLVW